MLRAVAAYHCVEVALILALFLFSSRLSVFQALWMSRVLPRGRDGLQSPAAYPVTFRLKRSDRRFTVTNLRSAEQCGGSTLRTMGGRYCGRGICARITRSQDIYTQSGRTRGHRRVRWIIDQ